MACKTAGGGLGGGRLHVVAHRRERESSGGFAAAFEAAARRDALQVTRGTAHHEWGVGALPCSGCTVYGISTQPCGFFRTAGAHSFFTIRAPLRWRSACTPASAPGAPPGTGEARLAVSPTPHSFPCQIAVSILCRLATAVTQARRAFTASRGLLPLVPGRAKSYARPSLWQESSSPSAYFTRHRHLGAKSEPK